MITLRIGNIFTDIVGDLPSEHYKQLERKLSFRPEGYQFSPLFNRLIRNSEGKVVGRAWDGWKRQCWKNKSKTYFPTGLISIAVQYFNDNKIEFQHIDYRQKPEPNFDFSPHNDSYDFRDYQKLAIDTACNRTRGILQLPTGAGKTVVGSGIIEQLRLSPFIFFVTSIDLLTQTKRSFEDILRRNGCPLKVGQIGGGVVDIADVNVMTVQTAVRALDKSWKQYKYDNDDTDDDTDIESRKADIRELINTAKGSICDEIQHWRADTCQLVAREMKSAYYTYGMSATPFRDAGDDMLIQACFGKVIYTITASELIQRGFLIPPSIKMLRIAQPTSLYRQWQGIYKDQVVENKPYNNLIASIANKFSKSDRLVLVLVQQIQHGKDLASMIDGAVFLSGNSPKNKRTESIDRLKNRDISCIVSTTIFDEGIDVRPLDTLLLAGQGKSRVRAMQRIGRVMRPWPGKTHATVVDFFLNQKYLRNHGKDRLKMYGSEPLFQIEELNIDL
jgi:superfamily II DNA or RNA helicase